MNDELTVSDLDLLLSALAHKRRDEELADWFSEELRQNSLARNRALEAKLVALRARAEQEHGP